MIRLPALDFTGFFTKEMISKKAVIPGIYKIYNNEKVLMYIGKSNDIFRRMYCHFIGSGEDQYLNHNYSYFDFAIVNDPVNRDIYETYYINEMKPPINVSKTFSYETQRDKFVKKFGKEKSNVDFQRLYSIIEDVTLII